jgi:D-alanyl-D-alanine carboxypeptidase
MKTTIPQPELATMHRELGIPSDYELRTKLPFFQEISLSRLVVAQLDDAGRPLVLSQETAKSWHSMQAAASAAGISLLPFSGFREALDITTTGCPAAEEVFSQTSAYSWLSENAGNYGFKESFGPHNPHSLVYEPWHWKFHPGSVSYKA